MSKTTKTMKNLRTAARGDTGMWRAAQLWEHRDIGWHRVEGGGSITLRPGESHEGVIARLRAEDTSLNGADLVLVESGF